MTEMTFLKRLLIGFISKWIHTSFPSEDLLRCVEIGIKIVVVDDLSCTTSRLSSSVLETIETAYMTAENA